MKWKSVRTFLKGSTGVLAVFMALALVLPQTAFAVERFPGGGEVTPEAMTAETPARDAEAGTTPVPASSVRVDPGYEPDKAFDGDEDTRWASADGQGSDPVTLTLPFDTTLTFNRVELRAWNQDDDIGGYKVQYLRKGGNPAADAHWVTISEAVGTTLPHEGDVEIGFKERFGDGIRIVLTKKAPDDSASLYSLRVKYV